MGLEKIICVEQGSNTFGIGNDISEAFDNLKDNVTYQIDFEEVNFFKCVEIKVKQKLYIEENE